MRTTTNLILGSLCLLLLPYSEANVSTVGSYCEDYRDCPDSLWCQDHKCLLREYADCSGHRDMCRQEHRCDASSTCRQKNGSRCTTGIFFQCPGGASCTKVPGSRYRNYCFCTQGVATEEDSTCKPLAGKVLGACKDGNVCDDPSATCNTTTLKCECGPGSSLEPETLTCRLQAGENCAWDKKKMCEFGTICENNICKIMGGKSCAGGRRNFCEDGYVCIEGLDHCYGDIGTTIKRNNARCRPGATKDYEDFCWISLGEDCKGRRDLCYSRIYRPSTPGVCDPPTNTCKVPVNASWCTEDSVCPAGSTCIDRKCQCLFAGQSFARHTERVCGLPRGKVGAQCGTDGDPEGCVDAGAECKNKTRLCVCKTGYTENLNLATCELSGPKCTFHGEGVINTFFGKKMDVVIPCRFKMANFKCGKVNVEVFASKNQSQVGDVTVNLKKGTSRYRYTQTADNILKSSPWEMACLSDECQTDRRIKLSVDTTQALLEWDLLRIAYNRSSIHIECGHRKFKGRESYPEVLCGSPTGDDDAVTEFISGMNQEAGAKPDGFEWAWMWNRAFSSRRLTDRAVLFRQTVTQTNPVCTEASDIVTASCPGRVENMYNCSHLFDDATFDKSWSDLLSYTECFGSTIDPLQVYASCLKVMCNREANGTDISQDTCQTLTRAADLCDVRVGRKLDGSSAWVEPYMSLTHLLDRHAPQCRTDV